MNGKIAKGFTLIELVIVVSIIAILSGVSLFALNDARISGRDSKRRTDVSQIASGLELYKADLNYYPQSISFGGANTLSGGGNTYIQAVPNDPNTSNNYFYEKLPSTCDNAAASSYCTRFRLWAALEAQPTPTPASYCGSSPPSCSGSTCNFCVTNP